MISKVDEYEKVKNIVHTLDGNQDMWFLTEDSLYEVLMQLREVLGKEFRIYGTPDEPLFLAKDVAEWIVYSSRKVITMYLPCLKQSTKKKR